MIEKNTPRWKVSLFIIASLVMLMGVIIFVFIFSLSWGVGRIDTTAVVEVPSVTHPDPLIRPAGPLKPPVETVDPIRGDINAPVTIIYFSDFTCPFCKEMNEVWNEVLPSYSDEVVFVWKDLATHSGAASVAIHKAARCAQLQDRFWDYHDVLWNYEFNQSLSQDLSTIASSLELDMDAFLACFTNPVVEQVVYASTEQGINLGIEATPSYFINDQFFDGALDADAIIAAIESEL